MVSLIDPIELFEKLDRSQSSIKELRKAQHEILSRYYGDLQKERRIGIKLPTGSGKSLLAILILEAWRRSGKTVAILTANKGLAEDMKKRCDKISVPSATIFGAYGDAKYKMQRTLNLLKYKKGRIIGIFNYHSYLYGTEYKQEISPPDILVVDDASEFEIPRNDFFTIRIGREKFRKVYEQIILTLKKSSQLYPNLHDFEKNIARQTAIELVYFTDSEKILEIIRSNVSKLRKDANFMFSYDRNLKMLPSFLIFISNDEIEFRPLLIPETSLRMGDVEQTIFMSATLPDEELLHKIFGIRTSRIFMVDEKSISEEAFEEIETLGARLIFPLDLTDLKIRAGDKCKEIIRALIGYHNKVLILTNSKYESVSIQKYLDSKGIRTILYSNPDDGHYFAYKVKSGALVCPNRYLGLDFPGKSCQVEVIVRLPSIWDSVDAFQLSVLNNSYYVEQRIANRLIQSLGRCNRLVTDEAAYYILDSRILSRIAGEEQYLRYFPRNLYAELMSGYILSEGGNITKAIDYGQKSFFGVEDSERESFLEQSANDWAPRILEEFTSKYDLEIEAWEKSLVGSYELSGQLLDLLGKHYEENLGKSQRNLESLSAFSYYLSAMNYHNAYKHYNNLRDKDLCLEELRKAIRLGGDNSWFNNLRAIFNSLVEEESEKLPIDFTRIEVRQNKQEISKSIDDFVDYYSSKTRNWKQTYLELTKIINKGKHDQMIDALSKMFKLLGYRAIKGDNTKGEPDLMAFSPTHDWKHILSIEVKTREKAEVESKRSVSQTLADSGVVERRNKDYPVFPVLITQKEEFDEMAIEVARNKVSLLRTPDLSSLMQKTFEKMNKWEGLSMKNKSSFLDSFISPYELKEIFRPKDNPIIEKEAFQAF